MRDNKSLGVLLYLPAVFVFIFWCFRHVDFNQNCSGHLALAAQANSVELARQELGQAVRYLKHNGLTSGYTSICWNTPDENIGFFYTNLEASLAELDDLSAKGDKVSVLEASNCLLKLRDTLTDHGEKGTKVIYPDGLSIYPNNLVFALFAVVSAFMALVGSVMMKDV